RYATIIELGRKAGVLPQLELRGHSKSLCRLREVLYVAAESGQSEARVLLDVYHLYKGGSGHKGLPFVGKPLLEIFHMNDYPANPPRESITDADRVFPGDGIAPIKQVLEDIKAPNKTIVLSLELFNRSYDQQDSLEFTCTGLRKMKLILEGNCLSTHLKMLCTTTLTSNKYKSYGKSLLFRGRDSSLLFFSILNVFSGRPLAVKSRTVLLPVIPFSR